MSSSGFASGMISGPLVRYVLMAAVRDRLILSLMLMIVVGACLSLFLGSAALIEGDQFALVFAASGLRFAGVAGLVLFIVFYMRRSFDNKDIEFLLSRPLSRMEFILSHAVAFAALAMLVAAAIGFAVYMVNPWAFKAGHILWIISLAMEFTIMTSAALFFSMVLSSAAGSALAVFGLYILARLMGQLLGVAGMGDTSHTLSALMNIVSMVIPRLDLMAQSSWLIYSDAVQEIGYGFVLMQGFLYSALLTGAAIIDLRRRQF
jgi:hypothetical protein